MAEAGVYRSRGLPGGRGVGEEMAKFWESVVLMLFVYALAAVVSYFVALFIKMIFIIIKRRNARLAARAEAVAPAEAAAAAPKSTD